MYLLHNECIEELYPSQNVLDKYKDIYEKYCYKHPKNHPVALSALSKISQYYKKNTETLTQAFLLQQEVYDGFCEQTDYSEWLKYTHYLLLGRIIFQLGDKHPENLNSVKDVFVDKYDLTDDLTSEFCFQIAYNIAEETYDYFVNTEFVEKKYDAYQLMGETLVVLKNHPLHSSAISILIEVDDYYSENYDANNYDAIAVKGCLASAYLAARDYNASFKTYIAAYNAMTSEHPAFLECLKSLTVVGIKVTDRELKRVACKYAQKFFEANRRTNKDLSDSQIIESSYLYSFTLFRDATADKPIKKEKKERAIKQITNTYKHCNKDDILWPQVQDLYNIMVNGTVPSKIAPFINLSKPKR